MWHLQTTVYFLFSSHLAGMGLAADAQQLRMDGIWKKSPTHTLLETLVFPSLLGLESGLPWSCPACHQTARARFP